MLWKIAHIYANLITYQLSALELSLFEVDLNITECSSRWYLYILNIQK